MNLPTIRETLLDFGMGILVIGIPFALFIGIIAFGIWFPKALIAMGVFVVVFALVGIGRTYRNR